MVKRLVKTIKASKWQIRSTASRLAQEHGYQGMQEPLYVAMGYPKAGKYPLICAHYDTVVPMHQRVVPVKRHGIISNPHGVLGGDDRAGVFIAFELIKLGLPAHYAFFDMEECGGVGSNTFAREWSDWLRDSVSCYIGLDRRGHADAATYNCPSVELLNIVERYGYHEAFGSFTDISNLENAVPKAGINLSVGFYNEHTSDESVFVPAVFRTLDCMKSIIRDVQGKEFTYTPPVYYPFPRSSRYNGLQFDDTVSGCRRHNNTADDYFDDGYPNVSDYEFYDDYDDVCIDNWFDRS